MLIYKITNVLNNKIYIGQTTRTTKIRLNKHINDMNTLDTKLARAMRKYGKENFIIEKIDDAKTQEELDKKEQYWITYYNSIETGYNMTKGSCGGNTYLCKTDKEMSDIKEKIRKSKLGSLNPMSKKVKCKNVLTQKELFFDCAEDCRKYFDDANHNFITRRCLRKTKFLYKGEWLIAYKDDEYITDYTFSIGDMNYRAKKVKVLDKETGVVNIFNSLSSASLFYGYDKNTFSNKRPKDKNTFTKFNRFEITILN